MAEADDRTTHGIADGVTRTYHGITGDLVTPQGLDVVTDIALNSISWLALEVA